MVAPGSSEAAALGRIMPQGAHLPGEIVRVARFSFLAYSGRLLEATAESIDPTLSHDMAVEWARSPARMITALILQQEGRLSAAIRIAADARQLSVLGLQQ